jgi:hypothetical protein
MTTTDTPRTDAVYWKFHTQDDMVNLARNLERELAISLENQMKAVLEREKCCRDGNAISDLLFDTERRLATSNAEVERLRKEIAFREDLDGVAQEVWGELKAENSKLREIVERYRVWATSENPTQIELDNLKQKYDELN